MMNTYQEILNYLYSKLPMYQRVGAIAYKKDLTNTLALCRALGNPESRFPSVHVAGTNGKGSVSNMLAAIFQAAGYKTGLYTSPHLKDFRERIRINGQMIQQQAVVDFVRSNQDSIEQINPSFFEATVALCFDCFAKQNLDWAVIETGLGGRLDSTNVIRPRLSLITNISWDHADLLGDTLEKIAGEKAGIIKEAIPVVVGETQAESAPVFIEKAKQTGSTIVFADQMLSCRKTANGLDVFRNGKQLFSALKPDLKGDYQLKNILTVIEAAIQLELPQQAIRTGIEQVCQLTGLRGRWDVLSQNPLIVADIAHNEAGIKEVVAQIDKLKIKNLFIVLGMVADKDHEKILTLLPKNATYFFCRPDVVRGLDAEKLSQKAAAFSLRGSVEPSVAHALQKAKNIAQPQDMIYVGGSTFVVAEVL